MNLDAPLHTYIPSISRELARAEAREHAYRPALKALLEALKPGFQAINEPAHIDVGAPDFIVLDGQTPIGFVEAKDIGEDLRRVERSEQLRRYLSALPNLILTDYVEFRWYVKGEHRETARLGEVRERKLRTTREEVAAVASLLSGFALETTPTILTAAELATRMAAMTREIRRLIEHSLDSSASLQSQKAAFEHTLLPNLAAEQFADLYAQTIAYGLFAARVRFAGEPEKFTLHRAFWDLPETNPFLRGMFQQLALDFDSRVAWLVDALAALLARADTDEILRDFGRSTRQEDPVVHFYETFLSIYDPVLRERRGVYYTPEPVVDYIVRSVDILLQTHFNRPAGLADAHTLILDPATGTGTFLYFVIRHIYETLRAQGQLGAWDHYVGAHLLPRLFGFELLVAPYAVAHMKLGIALQDLGYTFRSGQRLGIYLTNTLEAEIRPEETPLGLAGIISQEASAAESVKREKPIMVVLGNPPYSGHSSNRGDWISGLIRDYYFVDGQPLGERNPKWLQDDYVKFIRFGQWRIAQTGEGVLAFITNHGYLDNPTFRGMRQQLMAAFSDIYILNLHGNSKKKEVAPDGSPDQNVFDIQQGVAIGLFVKRGSETPPPLPLPASGEGAGGRGSAARVHYADLWGDREGKYEWLLAHDLANSPWQEIAPEAPFYLFVPQDVDLKAEYEWGWKITEAMPVNVLGFQTHRDHFAIDFERERLHERIAEMRSDWLSDEQFRAKHGVQDNRDWQLSTARASLRQDDAWEEDLIDCLYRPFDWRPCYFSETAMDYPRRELTQHVAGRENLALLIPRQIGIIGWRHIFVGDTVAESCAVSAKTKEQNYLFALYLYPDIGRLVEDRDWPPGPGGRTPNLAPAFVRELETRLGMRFEPHPPAPSPQAGRGSEGQVGREDRGQAGRGPGASGAPYSSATDTPSPSSLAGRGPGGGVLREDRAESRPWYTPTKLWEKLKPLAQQKRIEPTPAEQALWKRLRKDQLAGVKFRRQHTFGPFIVDFYAHDAGLIIEVDGPIHEYTQQEDALRQEYLESLGLRVLRFRNEDVLDDIERVLQAIAAALPSTALSPSPQTRRDQPGLDRAFGTTPSPSLLAGRGPGGGVFYPEDVFAYAYAVFHSPTYRARYAEFLKIDFPRLPLTSNPELFAALVEMGAELVDLHLLRAPAVNRFITTFPAEGDGRVERSYPKYDEKLRRVTINKTQYFEGVPPQVWTFYVGGYQVLEKWLKDRRERVLTWDDIQHYQRIVVALAETIRLMEEIDALIPGWPLV